MISIDFSLAIALFNFVFLALLLAFWIFSKKQKDKDLSLNPKFIWFCSICTYTYVNTKEDVISTCPRCGNYNKR
ncbi:MAG: hypothetical protein ABIG31_01810 [Candidatus Omnitrophota bacterium]